LREGELRKPIL